MSWLVSGTRTTRRDPECCPGNVAVDDRRASTASTRTMSLSTTNTTANGKRSMSTRFTGRRNLTRGWFTPTKETSVDQATIDRFKLCNERERNRDSSALDVVRSLRFRFILRGFVDIEGASHSPRAMRWRRSKDSSIKTLLDCPASMRARRRSISTVHVASASGSTSPSKLATGFAATSARSPSASRTSAADRCMRQR